MFVNLIPGVMRQIRDFAHQIAKNSAAHVHVTRERLTWLTVQVRVIRRLNSSSSNYTATANYSFSLIDVVFQVCSKHHETI